MDVVELMEFLCELDKSSVQPERVVGLGFSV